MTTVTDKPVPQDPPDSPPTFPFAGTVFQPVVGFLVFVVMFGSIVVLDLPWFLELLAFGLLAVFFVLLQVVLRRRWRARKKPASS